MILLPQNNLESKSKSMSKRLGIPLIQWQWCQGRPPCAVLCVLSRLLHPFGGVSGGMRPLSGPFRV